MERFVSLCKNPPLKRVSSNSESLTRFLVPMLLNPQLEIDRGNTPTRQAVIDYSILDLEIDQIVRRLVAMHSAIVRLKLAGNI